MEIINHHMEADNIKRLFKDTYHLRSYIGKFSLVGISGFIVNQGMLAILIELVHMDVKWAGIIAIELSIISNFLLNNFWTWRDKREQHIFLRFFKYHLVTLVSGGLNYAVLIGLSFLGMYPLIANLFGIALGTIVNFIFNHYWTFK
jgi:dolichol-phosphate mannosyltransferase